MAQLPSSDNSVKVANAALIALGSRPIEAFTDKTISARTVKHTFMDTLEEMLSCYPWRFARATLSLLQVPHNGRMTEWTYSYRWPAKALVIHEVWDHKAEKPVPFDIAYDASGVQTGRRIVTNTEPVIRRWRSRYGKVTNDNLASAFELDVRDDEIIDVVETDGTIWLKHRQATLSAEATVMVGPHEWPGYFRKAFIHRLAAQIGLAVTSDHGITQVMEQRAEKDLMYAKSRDAQSRTPPKIDTGLFIRARRGGRR